MTPCASSPLPSLLYTREQVWAKLLAEGAAIREEPLATDAWAVAPLVSAEPRRFPQA